MRSELLCATLFKLYQLLQENSSMAEQLAPMINVNTYPYYDYVALQYVPGSLNSGDTAWMLAATAIVLFMTMPGLAIYYSGMVRDKNVLACKSPHSFLFLLPPSCLLLSSYTSTKASIYARYIPPSFFFSPPLSASFLLAISFHIISQLHLK